MFTFSPALLNRSLLLPEPEGYSAFRFTSMTNPFAKRTGKSQHPKTKQVNVSVSRKVSLGDRPLVG